MGLLPTYEDTKLIAQDGNPAERLAIASHSETQPEILYYLADDPDSQVRQGIAANIQTPKQADHLLVWDDDTGVRCALALKICSLFPLEPEAEKDSMRHAVLEIVENLASDQTSRVRAVISEALKDVVEVPHDLILKLANDETQLVSLPVLEYSPVLTNNDLLLLARSSPVQGALIAISRRGTVNEQVADVISGSNNQDAITSLLANKGAQIREETLNNLVDEAIDVIAWHDPLVRRPELPAGPAQKIVSFVAQSLLDTLCARTDLMPATLAAVETAVARRLDGDNLDTPPTESEFGRVVCHSKQIAGRDEAVGAPLDDIADTDADDATVVVEGSFLKTSTSSPSPPVGTDVDEAVGAPLDDIADNDADDATVVVEGSFLKTSTSSPSPPVGTDVDNKTVITTSAHEKTLFQVSSTDAIPNVETSFAVSLESENTQELAATRGSLQTDIESKPLPTENQASLRNAISDGYVGVINKLLEAKLLSRQQVQVYISHAQDTGNTFFSELTKDRTGDDNLIIYRWVANEIDCELIEDSSVLEEMLAEPVEWLSPSIAERRNALIIRGDGNASIKYGTTDPFNITTRDWIERRTGKTAEIVAIPPTTFREAIARLRSAEKSDEEMDQGVIDITFSSDQEQEFQDELDIQEVPRMVEYFLHKAYIQKASDIHVEPTESGLLVRNRVDGMLHDECQLPPSIRRAVASRIKILANMDVAERRRPQDGRISVIINKAPIDIRASVYPTVHGEKIVMRLLDQTSLSPSPNDLGMIEKDLRKLIDKINSPLGLILLCGPTGSGKTTTLYSCLGSIDRRTKNVLTCEDPVEYRLEGVHQMQVNEKIGVTFAAGLRTILRQDPDVIMVGECRDEETANMAIQASLTGHVVFSTIHANDAVGVVTRLLDMNIDPFLVSSAITLSIAQRLIRTVCRNCATQSVNGDEILRRLREDGVSDEKLENLGIKIDRDLEYVSPTGCHICRDTGYSGRRPVFEIFEMTNECRRMIMSDDFDPGELKRAARRGGMSTLVEHALTLIEDGITTHAEIIRVLGENDL